MSSSTKMIVLRSSDGEIFEVGEEVAVKSKMLKLMIEDNCANNTIPISNVTGKILALVIEYCKKHVEAPNRCTDERLKNFDEEFIKVDQVTLHDILMAANYLEIKDLMDLGCQAVVNLISGKSPEEIRRTLNIRNDLSPEQEEEVRMETAWKYE